MTINNSAIYLPEDDFLGFESLASSVFDTIKSKNPLAKAENDKVSANFGIYGGWGEGKTSLVNLVCKRTEKEKYRIINLDVWKYKNSDEIVSDLIKKIRNLSFWSRLRDWVSRYVIIPFIVLLGAFVLTDLLLRTDILKQFIKFSMEHDYKIAFWIIAFVILFGIVLFFIMKSNKLTILTPISRIELDIKKGQNDERKNALRKLVRKKKIIIVVDDIDRSASFSEIPELFTKLSELFFIENFNFLFLFDRNKVEKVLKKANPGYDLEFINKHIDFHFYLPEMDEERKRNFIKKWVESKFAKSERLTPGFFIKNHDLFPDNPRQIKMILRDSMILEKDIDRFYEDELNLRLYLLFVILRHVSPDLWEEVAKNTKSFISLSSGNKTTSDIIKEHIDVSIKEKKISIEGDKEYIKKIMAEALQYSAVFRSDRCDYYRDLSNAAITRKEYDESQYDKCISKKPDVVMLLRDLLKIYSHYSSYDVESAEKESANDKECKKLLEYILNVINNWDWQDKADEVQKTLTLYLNVYNNNSEKQERQKKIATAFLDKLCSQKPFPIETLIKLNTPWERSQDIFHGNRDKINEAISNFAKNEMLNDPNYIYVVSMNENYRWKEIGRITNLITNNEELSNLLKLPTEALKYNCLDILFNSRVFIIQSLEGKQSSTTWSSEVLMNVNDQPYSMSDELKNTFATIFNFAKTGKFPTRKILKLMRSREILIGYGIPENELSVPKEYIAIHKQYNEKDK